MVISRLFWLINYGESLSQSEDRLTFLPRLLVGKDEVANKWVAVTSNYITSLFPDFCIHAPTTPDWSHLPKSTPRRRVEGAPGVEVGADGLEVSCTVQDLRRALQQRDPLDKGFHDVWGLDLLWRLLRWDPTQRISAREALEHAYFKGPYVSSIDGSQHATPSELKAYDSRVEAIKAHTDTGVTPPAIFYSHPFLIDREGTMPTFVCPQCQRTFSAWSACQAHVRGRGHARFCEYNTSTLPACISWHSMVPYDPHSGWCDVQGRRAGIEDFHSIVFMEDYKFYAVFDGHWG